MSPLVLDGYPAVMRQTIRSELFQALPLLPWVWRSSSVPVSLA